jgi:hypothetical protein
VASVFSLWDYRFLRFYISTFFIFNLRPPSKSISSDTVNRIISQSIPFLIRRAPRKLFPLITRPRNATSPHPHIQFYKIFPSKFPRIENTELSFPELLVGGLISLKGVNRTSVAFLAFLPRSRRWDANVKYLSSWLFEVFPLSAVACHLNYLRQHDSFLYYYVSAPRDVTPRHFVTLCFVYNLLLFGLFEKSKSSTIRTEFADLTLHCYGFFSSLAYLTDIHRRCGSQTLMLC